MKKFDISSALLKTNVSTVLFKIVISMGLFMFLILSFKSIKDITLLGMFLDLMSIVVLFAIWTNRERKMIKTIASFSLVVYTIYIFYDFYSNGDFSISMYGALLFYLFLILLVALAVWYPHNLKSKENNELNEKEDNMTIGKIGIWSMLNEADVSTSVLKLIVSLGLVSVLLFGFHSIIDPTPLGIFVDTMSLIGLLAIWINRDKLLIKTIASIGPATLTVVILYNLYIADVNSRGIPGGMLFLFIAICVFLAIWYPLIPQKDQRI